MGALLATILARELAAEEAWRRRDLTMYLDKLGRREHR